MNKIIEFETILKKELSDEEYNIYLECLNRITGLISEYGKLGLYAVIVANFIFTQVNNTNDSVNN